MPDPTSERVREKLRAVFWPGFDQDIVAAAFIKEIPVTGEFKHRLGAAGFSEARVRDDRRCCGISRAGIKNAPGTVRSSREL